MTTPPMPPEYGTSSGGEPNSDEQTMAMISHFGIVLFGWLPALIIYLVKGDSPCTKSEAAKAFNIAVTIQIGYIAFFVLGIVIAIADIPFIGCLTSFAYFGLWICGVVFGVINGMKINKNEVTKYPFEIPILK